jgi:hypothetical protein
MSGVAQKARDLRTVTVCRCSDEQLHRLTWCRRPLLVAQSKDGRYQGNAEHRDGG